MSEYNIARFQKIQFWITETEYDALDILASRLGIQGHAGVAKYALIKELRPTIDELDKNRKALRDIENEG